nr:pentapeptide repeat-containing protein [Micromonospora chokoriensis]
MAEGRMVTCAHVINSVLGRPLRDASKPDGPPLILLFPFGQTSDASVPRRAATVESWQPTSGAFDGADLAILRVMGDLPPGVEILTLADQPPVGAVQMWGPVAGRANPGHVTGTARGEVQPGRIQVDQSTQGAFRVKAGFSGGPVWLADTGEIVGILQASATDGGSDAYILDVSLIRGSVRSPPAAATAQLSVLQLPDLRFIADDGRHHQHLVNTNLRHETAVARLLADLHGGWRSEVPSPDLIVATGDLADRAMPAEYEAVYTFLVELAAGLGLGPDRLVLVPGDHDVNRLKSQAYFLDRESEGLPALAPYWPKWEPYAAVYRSIRQTGFTREEPWSLFEYPELRTVVAGMNSTMADSHQSGDRVGWLGDEQLRTFKAHLERAGRAGWTRVGVLHHDPMPGPDAEGTGLRDADRFADLIAGDVDLVLHGHHRDHRVRLLGAETVPVVGTAAVAADRAGRGADGYQLVRVESDRIRVWARRQDPESGRWEADYSVSSTGRQWQRDIPRTTARTSASRPPRSTQGTREPGPSGKPILSLLGTDTFLDRVAEVCRLREPAATVTPMNGYLRVSVNRASTPDAPPIIEQYPVLALDATPTQADVEAFVQGVASRYRAVVSAGNAKFVYGGDAAPDSLRTWAARRGVELLSFAEHQMGFDPRPYAQRQTTSLTTDPTYPPGLYVPQRYAEIDSLGGTGTDQDDALARIRGWLAEPAGHLVLVLAPSGHGKTFLLRELARRMHTEGDPAVPVIVHLRDMEKAHDLDELAAAQLIRGGERRVDLEIFRYLLREGRIALLFDGFDELAVRMTYERAADHLATIVQSAAGRAKVVLTSRGEHFLTDTQVLSALGEQLTGITGRRLVKIRSFDDVQIRRFLYNRLNDDKAAQQRLDLLRDVRDLLGLSRNPRMLDFIARIDNERLVAARDATGGITAARLYQELLTQWLEFEQRRLDRPGGAPPLTVDQLWHGVTVLASALWNSAESGLGVDELGDAADAINALTGPGSGPRRDREHAVHLLGSGTLLVRTGERRFSFVHRSVLEWLVARQMAVQLGDGEAPDHLNRPMSELMVEFLAGLADVEVARRWARSALDDVTASATVKENAMLLLKRLGTESALRLAGNDLRGHDLSGRDLRDADFRSADLTDARLNEADLTGATFVDALLMRARFDRANLTRSDLSGSDLTGTSLLGADLTDAVFDGSKLVRAKLVGTAVTDAMLSSATTTVGAALPGLMPEHQLPLARASLQELAFSPEGSMIAAAGGDGVVRVWDTSTGRLVRGLPGKGGTVWSVRWSPDGRHLASAGGDGVVRIWDAGSGKLAGTLDHHERRVLSVAWSPDGRYLATGDGDGVLRVWDAADHSLASLLEAHTGAVVSVDWSPDSQFLSSAANVVRIWHASSGRQVRELAGYVDRVWSAVWAPEGHLIASASLDGAIRVFDSRTGIELHVLAAHSGAALSVAWSPDGSRLASAGGDGIARIWDAQTGQIVSTMTGHDGAVLAVAWSSDGRYLASAGEEGLAWLWSVDTAASLRQLTGHSRSALSVRWSPDGRQVASAYAEGTVRVWQADTGIPTRELRGRARSVWAVDWSPSGGQIVSASVDGMIRIWDVGTGALSREFAAHVGEAWSVKWSPKGNCIASAGDDGAIRIWSTEDGALVHDLTGHVDRVWSLNWSPTGDLLASAGVDGTVRIWNTQTGKVVRRLTGQSGEVWSVTWSPDGRRFASSGGDGVLRIYEVQQTAIVLVLTSPGAGVWSVAWSPTGRHLACAGVDGAIQVRDAGSGDVVQRLAGHVGRVWSLSWSPDGSHLASAGGDGAVRVWEAATGARRYAWVPLGDGGWAILLDDLRYKVEGSVADEFWYTVNMCRFEPGELDPYLPMLRRLPADAPVLSVANDHATGGDDLGNTE